MACALSTQGCSGPGASLPPALVGKDVFGGMTAEHQGWEAPRHLPVGLAIWGFQGHGTVAAENMP